MEHEHHHEDKQEQPITPTMLFKFGAVLTAICTTLVSIVWFCASVKQDQALQRDDLDNVKRTVTENKTSADKQFADANAHQINTDRNVEELNRKLDVATTILERIDGKLNKP